MIIGITGLKRSGKDTIADFLVSDFGFEKYSFATPLKKAVCEIFGWDFNTVEKNENKEKIDPNFGISYRQACQDLGTEWGQLGLSERFPEFKMITGRNLWVKRFIAHYNKNKLKNIVIPDIRFPHEEKAIKDLDGKIIKVIRPQIKNNDIHESEKHIGSIIADYNIINNKEIFHLKKKIISILNNNYKGN